MFRSIRCRFGLALISAITPLAAACGGGSDTTPPQEQKKVASDDERGSIGNPPPAVEYCQKLGDVVDAGRCVFGDGTSCEQWSFYQGSCGQPHSYCNLHGGKITNEARNMGTWTASIAVCELDGKRCDEDSFFRTGKCE